MCIEEKEGRISEFEDSFSFRAFCGHFYSTFSGNGTCSDGHIIGGVGDTD